MAGSRDGIILTSAGKPVTNATVAVYNGITTSTLASIFSDSGLTTPLSNPFPADSVGNYFYYAAGGTYTEAISAPGDVSIQRTIILPSDAVNLDSPGTIGATTPGIGHFSDIIVGGPVIDVRSVGAVADGVTDNWSVVQTAMNANPGKTFLFTIPAGSSSATYFFSQPLTVKGPIRCDPEAGFGIAPVTLKFASGQDGLIILNANGPGRLRGCKIASQDRFVPRTSTYQDDLIVSSGLKTIRRDIATISVTSNVATVTMGTALDPSSAGCHTFAPGSQVHITGVAEDTAFNGYFFVTAISHLGASNTCYNKLQFAITHANTVSPISPAAGFADTGATGPTYTRGVVLGANFSDVQYNVVDGFDVGFSLFSDSSVYWADDDLLIGNIAQNSRGMGYYVHGADSNISTFINNQSYFHFAGCGYDDSFLGNNWIGGNCSTTGRDDIGTILGPTHNVTGIVCAASICTATTANAHNLKVGQGVEFASLLDATYQQPSNSAVMIASVPTSTTFTYHFYHADGSIGAGGTASGARYASMLTATGVGQNVFKVGYDARPSGSAGDGFSWWIDGLNDSRYALNMYCEGDSAPLKMGTATYAVNTVYGCPTATGYSGGGVEISAGGQFVRATTITGLSLVAGAVGNTGSATNPLITFGDELNSGFYKGATNIFETSIGGVDSEQWGVSGGFFRWFKTPSSKLLFGDGTGTYPFGEVKYDASIGMMTFNSGASRSTQGVCVGDGTTVVASSADCKGPIHAGTSTLTGNIVIGGGTAILKHLSATASLNFAAWAGADCQDLTMTVTGATDGDTVSLGIPTALASVAGVEFRGFVSSAGTVTVRGCKITSGASADPAAATVRADVWQH